MMQFVLCVLLVVTIQLSSGVYRTEGQFTDCENEKHLFLASCFLPYNPIILAFGSDPEMSLKSGYWMPKSQFFFADSAGDIQPDLIWIESNGKEIEILENIPKKLTLAKVIYTSTHFFDQGIYFQNLKFCLELAGFSFLAHWYWEGERGNAIFVKKEILDAMLRSLNYSSPAVQKLIPVPELDLIPFFKPALNKGVNHSLDQIDFIYMINLDQRPEKFAVASESLREYGIYPYRFSAVNGWQLPHATIEQIGVKFFPGMLHETFLGKTYTQVEGEEYFGNELLKENATTYFSPGISQGAIGIVLSHLSILQDAYDSGYRTIWVMEDDIDPVDDPRQISGLISKLDQWAPDWDIFFTDTDTKNIAGQHIPCRATAARPNVNVEPLAAFFQRFYSISDDLMRIGMRYGAYSMIMRRSGITKILNYYKQYRIFLPYDVDFWLIPDLKMYSVRRDIVSHRCGAPSDNSLPNYKR